MAAPAGRVIVYRAGGVRNSIVAYDLGADRELWTIDDSSYRWTSLAVAGEYLIMADAREVALYRVTGERTAQLRELSEFDSESAGNMAVSPNGKLVAIVIGRSLGPSPTPLPPGPGGGGFLPDDLVVVYDVETQHEVVRFDYHDPAFPELGSGFGALQWRDDGEGVLLWIAATPELAGPYFTLYLDGRIEKHQYEGWAFVAPSSRRTAEGFGSLGCMFISGHDVVLRDLDNGAVLGELHDESRAFSGFDWSPDSTQFLFESWPYEEPWDCGTVLRAEEPALLLLDTVNGEVSDVSDAESLLRGWYGDALLWMECAGEFAPIRPHAFGNVRVGACEGPGRLYVGDQDAGVGETFQIVGIIE